MKEKRVLKDQEKEGCPCPDTSSILVCTTREPYQLTPKSRPYIFSDSRNPFCRCSHRCNHFNLHLQWRSAVCKVQEAYVMVLDSHDGWQGRIWVKEPLNSCNLHPKTREQTDDQDHRRAVLHLSLQRAGDRVQKRRT